MQLTITKTLVDNKYAAEFDTTLTQSEQDLVTNFGEPLVDFGGSFTGPPAFTLASNVREINSGVPYSYEMDSDVDVDAETKMGVYVTEMRAKFISEITTLRAKSDGWTGQTIETV